jgi:hypothetical protein
MSPREDRPKDDDGKVLSPEELDIAEDERVAEIDDGRYVVSSDDSRPSVPEDDTPSRERRGSVREATDAEAADRSRLAPQEGTDREGSGSDGDELTEEAVRQWLRQYVGDTNSQYGYHVTAKFDDATRQQHLVSNDVVTVFENLLMWYGQQLDSQTAVEEVLGILLLESNMTVQYPQQSLKAYLAKNDLGPDDTIADLLETTEDGFAFPPG